RPPSRIIVTGCTRGSGRDAGRRLYAWLVFRSARLSLPRGLAASPRGLLAGVFAASSALNYAFSLIAAHLLDPGAYGVVAFGQAVLVVAALALAAGMPPLVTAAMVSR